MAPTRQVSPESGVIPFYPNAGLFFFFLTFWFISGKRKSSEDLDVHPGSEEGASEDKESVPEGVLEEGTSDSNTGSETTSAQTEDASANEPSEGPCKARAAH